MVRNVYLRVEDVDEKIIIIIIMWQRYQGKPSQCLQIMPS